VLTAWILVGRDFVHEPVFAALKNAGYVATMLLGFWAFQDGFARSWRVTRQRPLLAAGSTVFGLALMGAASALSQVVMFFFTPPVASENQVAINAEVLTSSTSLLEGLLFIGVGGFVAPIVEEIVFRELPFRRPRSRLLTSVAVVLSCLAFGAIHLRGAGEWQFGVLYVGYAAALTVAYFVSARNLLVPVTTHVAWNATGLTYLLLTA
jgi:membrane protease YdiL (CAAX protease family)